MPTLTIPEPRVIADLVIAAVTASMRHGAVPDDGTVATFGDLHDWVDANVYLIDAHEALGLPGYHPDLLPVDNAACDLVNAWLDHRVIEHRARLRDVEQHPYEGAGDHCARPGCGLRPKAPAHNYTDTTTTRVSPPST